MDDLFESIALIFFLGLLVFFVHWLAWKKNFFSITPFQEPRQNLPTLFQIAVIFGIYLGISFLIVPSLATLIFRLSQGTPPKGIFGWLQVAALCLICFLFFLFCKKQPRQAMLKIWKDPSYPGARSIFFDLGIGIMTWCISFPAVVFIGQISDLFLFLVFNVENYEQVAVRYLKTTLGSPSMLVVAIFAILIAAPVIEEFLFRGCLQNWLKRFLGSKAAIPLASLCFALFHISPSQGLGNISLVLSLFTFACYLGFIYERQRSLFASIGLHITFNAMSTLRILFD